MEGHQAERDHNKTTTMETTDRGMFDFMKKKDEGSAKANEDAHKQDNENIKEDQKPTLMGKLHRSDSNSSSSSDEEEIGEDGVKRKKKKGLKEKIKEKISGDKEATEHKSDAPMISTENPDQEKKGFLEKIKEKLPGQHKKADEDHGHPVPTDQGGVPKEKGILEKIKEKITPGGHGNKTEEEEEDHKATTKN